jgi:hypothetical protein
LETKVDEQGAASELLINGGHGVGEFWTSLHLVLREVVNPSGSISPAAYIEALGDLALRASDIVYSLTYRSNIDGV